MFPNLYTNAFKCCVETFKKDGIAKGLYAGSVPALTANIAGKEFSVVFLIYFFPFNNNSIKKINLCFINQKMPFYSCRMVCVRRQSPNCPTRSPINSTRFKMRWPAHRPPSSPRWSCVPPNWSNVVCSRLESSQTAPTCLCFHSNFKFY